MSLAVPNARMEALALDRPSAEMEADLGHAAQPGVALEHAPSLVPDDSALPIERKRERLGKVEEDLSRRVLDAGPTPGYRGGEGLTEGWAAEPGYARGRQGRRQCKCLKFDLGGTATVPRDASG